MRTLFLLLISATACFGQLTMQQMQPFFNGNSLPGVFYPTNVSGVSWIRWWVASDNTTNITITNWLDRIFTDPLTNTLALSPTNSSGGMGFNGSTSLRWKNPQPIRSDNTTDLLFMVVAPVTPASDFAGLYGLDDVALYSGGRGLFTRTSANYYWNDGVAVGNLGAVFSSGALMDVVVTAPNASATAMVFYTNGVLSTSIASGKFGRQHSLIGINPSVANFKGKIVEILLGTNTAPPQISQVVSNLHWYGTNTYKYSP